MKKLEIAATVESLPHVMEFIDANLKETGCGMKAQTQIEVSVEELFVNIAHYAYKDTTGVAAITFDFDAASRTVTISLIDGGVRYNPLSKPDPDITLSVEDRQIGGLGIFMVKKNMDEVLYDYADNKNVITIKKQI